MALPNLMIDVILNFRIPKVLGNKVLLLKEMAT